MQAYEQVGIYCRRHYKKNATIEPDYVGDSPNIDALDTVRSRNL